MAIQKSKTLNNGTTGNYWRILSVAIDRESFRVKGRIALFKDKATSDAGGSHLGLIKHFDFTFTMGEIVAASNIITYTYDKILAKAQSMITKDVFGADLETPIPFDADIAGGTPA